VSLASFVQTEEEERRIVQHYQSRLALQTHLTRQIEERLVIQTELRQQADRRCEAAEVRLVDQVRKRRPNFDPSHIIFRL
jgi:hypothetical protein